MSSKNLNPFKDFQSDQIQRSSRKILPAHYACRNAALNLTPVTGMTNGFIFQIINLLIESWGVRLTCFDCKPIEMCRRSVFLVQIFRQTPVQYNSGLQTNCVYNECIRKRCSFQGKIFPCEVVTFGLFQNRLLDPVGSRIKGER